MSAVDDVPRFFVERCISLGKALPGTTVSVTGRIAHDGIVDGVVDVCGRDHGVSEMSPSEGIRTAVSDQSVFQRFLSALQNVHRRLAYRNELFRKSFI